MPTIKVTVPRNAWNVGEKADIAQRLTGALASVGEASGKGDITPYINVHIEETSEGGYAMGGKVIG